MVEMNEALTPTPTAGNMILSDTRTNENEGIVCLAAGDEVDAHWCPEPEPQADPTTRRHPSLSPPAKGEHATHQHTASSLVSDLIFYSGAAYPGANVSWFYGP